MYEKFAYIKKKQYFCTRFSLRGAFLEKKVILLLWNISMAG